MAQSLKAEESLVHGVDQIKLGEAVANGVGKEDKGDSDESDEGDLNQAGQGSTSGSKKKKKKKPKKKVSSIEHLLTRVT